MDVANSLTIEAYTISYIHNFSHFENLQHLSPSYAIFNNFSQLFQQYSIPVTTFRRYSLLLWITQMSPLRYVLANLVMLANVEHSKHNFYSC